MEGGGSFSNIEKALKWVIDNHSEHNITAVCMSLGDSGNYTTDLVFSGDTIQARIQSLRNSNVAVAVAAGNDFFTHSSKQGMAYPSIISETVSVGAVYDANEGSFSYNSGAIAFSTAPDRITPFSQRLHESVNPDTRTDIFAPGAPVTSSGIDNDHGESIQHGTSQATPVTVGVVLLLQEYHLRLTDRLPSVDNLVTWLRNGGVSVVDGDNESDNVNNTGLTFLRLDTMSALTALRRSLRTEMLLAEKSLKEIYAMK